MAGLKIPDSQIEGVKAIAVLDARRLKTACEALGAIESIDDARAAITEALGSSDESQKIGNATRMLYIVKTNREYTAAEMATTICEAGIEQRIAEDWVEGSGAWRNFSALLDVEAADMAAKSFDLQAEFPRVLMDARIVSDIRPVFPRSDTKKPARYLCVHQLRIGYHEAGLENHRGEFYVVLDENDLDKLQTLVERAKSKHSTLKTVIAGFDRQKSEV